MRTALRLAFKLASAVLLASLLGGCMKPKYLMPGLSLPPGSTVVSETNSTTNSGGGGAPPLPMSIPGMPNMGNAETISVFFNNSGGWSSVSGHFDSLLGGKGYTDSMQALMGATGGPPGLPSTQGMRMYSKSGSKYTVMLMDFGGMMGAAGATGGTSVPGMGDFSLTVVYTK
jgi:hypothetical protein